MMVLGGAEGEKLYAPSPYHRWQADALLRGDLHIADSIQQIAHDNAWYNGKVNHVWGLGVGAWLTPFEAIWRLLGQKWFPDRIALGVAFAWLALYAGHTGWHIGRREKSPPVGIGFIWLVLCCPSLWALNYGSRLVYEETSLYATLLSLAILIATVRVAFWNRRLDFLVCAILAGLSGIVRPTHAIYGLAGVAVCSILLLLRTRPWKTIVLGNCLFASGLGVLAVTNQIRFGSPAEFGHRLTVTPDIIVYTTRFGNAMKDATVADAAKELLGANFLMGNLERIPEKGEKLIPWETSYERWRDPYMSTFDSIWMALGVIGGFAAIGRLIFNARTAPIKRLWLRKTETGVLGALVLWGALTVGGLTVFYLRLATFSSRYLLDFAPAFLSLVLVVWLMWPRRHIALGTAALAGWLAFELHSIQFLPFPVPLLDKEQLLENPPAPHGRLLADYRGRYKKGESPGHTRIAYNGYGWNTKTEIANSIVILAVDNPNFIELDLSVRKADAEGLIRPDLYRAMINAKFLPEPTIVRNGDKITVRFPLNEDVLRREGEELVFLWFAKDYSSVERESRRSLRSVRWR